LDFSTLHVSKHGLNEIEIFGSGSHEKLSTATFLVLASKNHFKKNNKLSPIAFRW